MMTSPRNQIIGFIEQGAIPAEKIDDALAIAKVIPDGKAWRTFIDHLLLWLGGLALAFAAMFFIAYNWNEIGRFSKFGMVEVLIVAAVVAYLKLGESTVAGKVSLLVASIFLGILLALYGQTYQTGADPWQLFFTWALLMLPWAFIGRYSAIWIVWVLLINLSIVLYLQTFRGIIWFMISSDTGVLWLVFLFNTFALIVWEVSARTWHWLSERWAVRLLAVGSGAPITWLVLYAIVDRSDGYFLYSLAWMTWLAAFYFMYRKIKPDLFMLAGVCLSSIVVLVTFLSRQMLENASSGNYLFLALIVIGLGSGAAVWLRNIHREWQL